MNEIEYLEEFNDLQSRNSFKGQTWFGERKNLVEEYSWAVPNREVLRYLSTFDHLYEIGAGNGYWAHCISEEGGTVTPIDINPPSGQYATIVEGNVSEYSNRIENNPVLMVWPPYDESMAADVALCRPSHIFYVGESRGGCTGSDLFFDIIDREYGLVEKIDIPSYEGVHDNFHHYVRNV